MRKQKDNETVQLMRWANMRFKRRLDIPMWHVDHLRKSITELEELTEELKRINNSNSLRHAEKCRYAQNAREDLRGAEQQQKSRRYKKHNSFYGNR